MIPVVGAGQESCYYRVKASKTGLFGEQVFVCVQVSIELVEDQRFIKYLMKRSAISRKNNDFLNLEFVNLISVYPIANIFLVITRMIQFEVKVKCSRRLTVFYV